LYYDHVTHANMVQVSTVTMSGILREGGESRGNF